MSEAHHYTTAAADTGLHNTNQATRLSAMPELPEVEASRALIDRHCTGRTILDVTAADDTSGWTGVVATHQHFTPSTLQSQS